MTDLLRQEIATNGGPIVVKVGTRVLAHPDGTLDQRRIADLADDLSGLVQSGRKVLLVSSGAVGAGMGRLGLVHRPDDLAHLQAVAAVGQSHLIQSYDRALQIKGCHAAQLLLTAEDFDHRQRYLNVRNTILKLLDLGVVPIINENDTVSVEELLTTFGDNDKLAAMVTNLVHARLLVILSDVDGLYDGDPADSESSVIHTVTRIDDDVMALAQFDGQSLGKGGMASKLQAARIVTAVGESVIIAGGHRPGVLGAIMNGEVVGTLLLARDKTISPWKRWIGFTAQPRGRLLLDHGARRAIETDGRSLLPIGVVGVEGVFEKGDVVDLCDPTGEQFARGLSNYDSREIVCIKGMRSDQIAEVLGHHPYDEVIHRDNMAVTS